MRTINRYIENQHAYVAKKKAQPLLGFTNAQGEQASWDDIAVRFSDSDGKTLNILFCNLNKNAPNIGTRFTEEDRLASDTHDLLFAYALYVLKQNLSLDNKRGKITAARNFLCHLAENVASASLETIQHAIDSLTYADRLTAFINWLHHHKMLAKSCQPYISYKHDSLRHKSGDEALLAEKSKLPSEKALLALGAIFHDIIPPYPEDDKNNIEAWQPLIAPTQAQRDSFACTMAALGMASPNRIGAEQVLLTTQRIQRHTQVVDGQEQTVHYLNWRGSKGYKDNQNHINAEMAESVDRALHYTILATEPARALARFYRQPNRPLKKVLGDFTPSDENIALLKPDLSKPTNLLHLGLLLGFFDGSDKCVRVTPDTKGAIDRTYKPHHPKFIKPIALLEPFDTLVFKPRCPYAQALTGCDFIAQSQNQNYTAGQQALTVATFQNHTIEINQAQLNGYNKQQTKSVDVEHALFMYTKKQIGGQVTHPFLLVPISSLSSFFADDLIKRKKNRLTLFERHGFASDFALKPHQLRHWQNDYLEKKGLPHHLITLLSGRKSAEQTLTYIHTTDAENASVIGDISYSNELESDVKEKVGLRIRTMNQYNEAIDNETPTFAHETGFCTQNLALSPCTYMSEFETQCALCSSSCHAAHDDEAIALLMKDLKVQTHNLERVQEAINFVTSESMQMWYKTHYRNTCMLKHLIEVLSDDTIEKGSMVRLLARSNSIRISNLETKTVKEHKLVLPDADQALQAALEAKNAKNQDEATNNFLGFLGSL
ncbi:hypothetical protein [Vibrio parahaemolyticus]|uniref:Integrase n=1 Tax=Vibrio parahaemolyticus TaxID=670 RepID=A0A7Y0SB75_VIBPH|nr:hypothetical protein [Vibrio parahaemolyticus]EHC7287583.1 hypothetical protein [Vibrio parahaemolyticus]EJE4146483.1 hypothetical protein [Vibrio parahaemolyticus]ELU0548824.1 hypothetical protein [Vibrio parahaemolyticus]MCZ5858319.1 hypothetical protein [Vibrio parahaemolyticus]MCZ6277650.1 hypothetical protein [Vibrio parahaemolyticus]